MRAFIPLGLCCTMIGCCQYDIDISVRIDSLALILYSSIMSVSSCVCSGLIIAWCESSAYVCWSSDMSMYVIE